MSDQPCSNRPGLPPPPAVSTDSVPSSKPYDPTEDWARVSEALSDAGLLDDPEEEGYMMCQAHSRLDDFFERLKIAEATKG